MALVKGTSASKKGYTKKTVSRPTPPTFRKKPEKQATKKIDKPRVPRAKPTPSPVTPPVPDIQGVSTVIQGEPASQSKADQIIARVLGTAADPRAGLGATPQRTPTANDPRAGLSGGTAVDARAGLGSVPMASSVTTGPPKIQGQGAGNATVTSGRPSPRKDYGAGISRGSVTTGIPADVQQQRDVWGARYAGEAIRQGAGMSVTGMGPEDALIGNGIWNQLPTSSRVDAFTNREKVYPGLNIDAPMTPEESRPPRYVPSTGTTLDPARDEIAKWARGIDEMGNPILNENDLAEAARLTQGAIMQGQMPDKISGRVAGHLTWPRKETDYSFQYYGRTFDSAQEWLDFMGYLEDPSTGWYLRTKPVSIDGGYGGGYSGGYGGRYGGGRVGSFGGSGGTRGYAGYGGGLLVNWRI